MKKKLKYVITGLILAVIMTCGCSAVIVKTEMNNYSVMMSGGLGSGAATGSGAGVTSGAPNGGLTGE